MKQRLYIGNLAYSVTRQDLQERFAPFGAIREIRLVTEKDGQSKGFAFVEFENSDDAQAAAEALDGKDINGRKIRVNEARERERRHAG